MFKSRVPISVQFELTYDCNNHCTFCYNHGDEGRSSLDTVDVEHILKDVASSGVLTVNFNGGEPLLRSDFLDIASYAKKLDLDIHLNTNATLIQSKKLAKDIAQLFPAVCVTILSGKEDTHDNLSGRSGALKEVSSAIKVLQENGVYVAVNVMLSNVNKTDFLCTLSLLLRLGIQTVLVTRYIPCGEDVLSLHISDEDFFCSLRLLYEFQQENKCFSRISLPQPVKICIVPPDLRDTVKNWNIPCYIGLCTASISCDGYLTPCNLVKKPVLGNLLKDSFSSLWDKFNGDDFSRNCHLKSECITCQELPFCGGGCKGFNDGFKSLIGG